LIAAYAFERAFLAHDAQQFHLRARIDLPDFIEEKCTAIGLLKPANAPFVGAGKRASLVPEQLALEKLRRKRSTVYNHKFRFVTPAEIVNGVRR
jgi:hypothetical protein